MAQMDVVADRALCQVGLFADPAQDGAELLFVTGDLFSHGHLTTNIRVCVYNANIRICVLK